MTDNHSAIVSELRQKLQPFVIAALFVVCCLHSLAHVSRPFSKLALATMKLAILGGIQLSGGRSAITPEHRALLRRIPTDVRTAMKILDLEPNFVTYAACARCFAIYAPDLAKGGNRKYPSMCTFVETDKAPCGEPLLEATDRAKARRERKARQSLEDLDSTPRRPYVYHTFKNWIAEMLSTLR